MADHSPNGPAYWAKVPLYACGSSLTRTILAWPSLVPSDLLVPPGFYALRDVGADVLVEETVVEIVVHASERQHIAEVLALVGRDLNTEKTVLAPGARQIGYRSGQGLLAAGAVERSQVGRGWR